MTTATCQRVDKLQRETMEAGSWNMEKENIVDKRIRETRPMIDIYDAHSCCIILSSTNVEISAVGA
jgi:hypothetical protein